MDLSSSNFKINSLTEDEILDILKEQKSIVESNFAIYKKSLEKYKKKESLIIEILKTYLNKQVEYKENFSFLESIHKNNTLLHSLDMNQIKETEFYEILNVIYWEEHIKPISSKELLVRKDEVGEYHYKRLRVEKNLKELYNKHPVLFSNQSLGGTINLENKFKGSEIEEGTIRFFTTELDPELEVECEKNYFIILKYGEILKLVCSPYGLTSLSFKGFNTLNIVSLNESKEHIKEQNIIINEIKEIREKQEDISREMSKQTDSFYQNITTILSLLVAAFSFIGVNISAIPKIDENFTINIITINASLILVLSVMFLFLYPIIGVRPPADGGHMKKIYMPTIIICLVFVTVGIVYGFILEESEEEKVKEHIEEISEKYMLIDKNEYKEIYENIKLMNQKIEKLEVKLIEK